MTVRRTLLSSWPETSGQVSSWKFLEEVKKTFTGPGLSHVRLRPGLELVHARFVAPGKARHVFRFGQDAPLELGLHISGRGYGDLRFSRRRAETVAVEPSSALLSFYPDVECTTVLRENEYYELVNIYMDPKLLEQFFPGTFSALPDGLRALRKGSPPSPFNHRRTFSPLLQMALAQLLACPLQDCLGRMYMEAKILELFALMFSDVTTVSRGVKKRQLTSGDRERLHMARDLLTADLENPPSISEVARASGLSENKLKWGFREVFGQPPYAYLLTRRLEKGRELLAATDCSVSEVAHQLGFCDASHFVRHFKSRFGLTPGLHANSCRL